LNLSLSENRAEDVACAVPTQLLAALVKYTCRYITIHTENTVKLVNRLPEGYLYVFIYLFLGYLKTLSVAVAVASNDRMIFEK
jgi:hypothetical protein